MESKKMGEKVPKAGALQNNSYCAMEKLCGKILFMI
jgi:hypothetical protein